MLKTLKLTCFRKVESDTMVFTEGLNVLRGANEASKSTRLESIGFALFGSRALRDTFENVVTWGRKPSELRVELELESNGETYLFSRGKSGAEVKLNGKLHVTGQNEVSNFAAQLLGADLNIATSLMIASQGQLQGALEGGPKQASALIEDLSGLDLIDKILDAAANKLTLGSAGPYEGRIQTLETYLGNLQEVAEPDAATFAAQEAAASGLLEGLQLRLDEALQPKADRIATQVNDEAAKRSRVAALRLQLDQCQRQIDEAGADLAPISGRDLTVQDTSELEARIGNLATAKTRREAYTKFLTLPDTERELRTVFDEQLKQAIADEAAAKATEVAANKALAVAQAQLVTSSVCGICGQDVSQFPAAREKNETLQIEIEKQKQLAVRAAEDAASAITVRGNLKGWMEWEDGLIRTARPIAQFLDCDESVVPCRYDWRGEVPAEVTESEPVLRAQLTEIRKANDAKVALKARIESLTTVQNRAVLQKQGVLADMAGVQAISDDAFNALASDLLVAQAAVADVNAKKAAYQLELDTLRRDFQQARDQYLRVKEQRERLSAEIEQTLEQIRDLEFNNALVRKIRAARPIIANKLWQLVLHSVSTIFSLMRKETSIVTRGKDGFEVNGRPATSLSGSAKDLLGLSLRCALVRTFIPQCSFITLDEPAASMDSDRETDMLGYVAAAGFPQCLLVTHSDLADSFANNMIRL